MNKGRCDLEFPEKNIPNQMAENRVLISFFIFQ